jgi:hypothetical protein
MKDALPERVSLLRQKLTRLQSLTANANEASALATLRRELALPAEALAGLVKQEAMLGGLGVKTKPPASLANVRRRAATIRDKFRAERKSAVLTKGTGWTTLLADGEAAAKDVQSALQQGWREFRASVYSGDTPAVIDKRLPRTPQNIKALADYQKVHAQFSALFLTVPANASTVETARALAGQLDHIAGQFDFAVGEEVKRFLAAVQSGGASLNLLTDDVVEWLAENDAADGYVIRPVDRS